MDVPDDEDDAIRGNGANEISPVKEDLEISD